MGSSPLHRQTNFSPSIPFPLLLRRSLVLGRKAKIHFHYFIGTVFLLADLGETKWVSKELNPFHSSRACPWQAIDHSRELCGRLCQWAVSPRRWMPLSFPAAQSRCQNRHVSPQAPPRGCSGCAGPDRAGEYIYWNGHRWKYSRDRGSISMLT